MYDLACKSLHDIFIETVKSDVITRRSFSETSILTRNVQDAIGCITVRRTDEIQRCVISTRLPPTTYNVYVNSNILIMSFYLLIRERFIPSAKQNLHARICQHLYTVRINNYSSLINYINDDSTLYT